MATKKKKKSNGKVLVASVIKTTSVTACRLVYKSMVARHIYPLIANWSINLFLLAPYTH